MAGAQVVVWSFFALKSELRQQLDHDVEPRDDRALFPIADQCLGRHTSTLLLLSHYYYREDPTGVYIPRPRGNERIVINEPSLAISLFSLPEHLGPILSQAANTRSRTS